MLGINHNTKNRSHLWYGSILIIPKLSFHGVSNLNNNPNSYFKTTKIKREFFK